MARQRIRESVSDATSAVEAAANLVLEMAADIQDHGILIELESVMGLSVPKTVIRVRLAEPPESEDEHG